ncbi:hypothetical protein GCM10010349_70080 [Streptomyces flavofungini]|nr:hypothetical protein GCM10010349_70080 [Streptomyces flavofungini]
MRQYRTGRREQAVLARRRGQLGQARAQDETALHVARHHPVVFQGHGQTMSRGSCKTGGRDQPGKGGGTGLQGAQDKGCLVENADAARVVHATILASHSVKRKFKIPGNPPLCRSGPQTNGLAAGVRRGVHEGTASAN